MNLEKFDNTKFVALWKTLHESKTCFMCKTKFPKGIMKKHPSKLKPLMGFFRGDFLFHLQSTHGIDPLSFRSMIMSFKDK